MDHRPGALPEPITTENGCGQADSNEIIHCPSPVLQFPTPPWPPPKIVDTFMFQAPHGAEHVIPSTTAPDAEKIELIINSAVFYNAPEGEFLAQPGAVFWHLPGGQTIHRYQPQNA